MKVRNKFSSIEYPYTFRTWDDTVQNKDCYDVLDWGDLVMALKIRQDNSKIDMQIYDRNHVIRMIATNPHRYAYRELNEFDWKTLKASVASYPDVPIQSTEFNPLNAVEKFEKENLKNHLMESKKRIFLCHANEDKPTVSKFYYQLKERGLNPWLDKEDLLPGQNWRQEIPKALRKSELIIIFFSSFSVSKRGYVQREFKLALDTLQEIPEGQIFIIPVRLDRCKIPDKFLDFHYVDLFESSGFEKVLKSIYSQIPKEEKPMEQSVEVRATNLEQVEFHDGPYYAAPTQFEHQKGKWAVFRDGAQMSGTVKETEEEAKAYANNMNKNP